ncbi:MAG: glycosyltransferase family 4 protein [Polyangiales bacterium]
MQVGLVTTGFPRFEGDCSGSFLLTLARGLVEQGHSVRVLAPEPRRAMPMPSWPGIDLRWLPYARPRRLQRTFYGSGVPDNLSMHPARILGAASFSAVLAGASKRDLDDCDALLSSWCLPSGWAASRAARGRPHLCICHATDVRWLSRLPRGRSAARTIHSGATSMWFLSPVLRDRFFQVAGLAPSRTTTHIGSMPIAPPIEPGASRTLLRQKLGMERFTLLFLGRLVPIKGTAELFHSVAKLPEQPSVRIAGNGPERAALQDLAQRLGIDAEFEGWVSGERKEALLKACDAVVVPSRPDDGLPTVLFEAKARGLPIIATDLSAIPAELRNREGVELVPPNDRQAFRDAIIRAQTRDALGSALRV